MRVSRILTIATLIAGGALFACWQEQTQPGAAAEPPALFSSATPWSSASVLTSLAVWESQPTSFFERALSRLPWLHAWLFPSPTWTAAQIPIQSFL